MTALLAEKSGNRLVAMQVKHYRLLKALAPDVNNRIVRCAAHLINYFERFQRWKEPRYENKQIYQPLWKIREELEGMYTIHSIRAAIALLRKLKFLSVEQNRRAENWRNGQDKTHQYLLHIDRIELALKNSYTPQQTAETPEKSPFVKIEPSGVRTESSDVGTELSDVTVETSYRTNNHLLVNQKEKINSLKEGERGGNFSLDQEEGLPKQNILDCTEELQVLPESEEICDNKIIPDVGQFSAASTSIQVETTQKPLPKLKSAETSRFKSQEERDGLYQELLELAKRKGGVKSPVGWASCIVKSIEAGEPCEYLEEYRRGEALGTFEMREWEIAPGRPHPQLVTYLKFLLGSVQDTEQQALAKALRELSYPERAEIHWQTCKRDIERYRGEWQRQQALGISNPHLPPELLPEPDVSLEEAIDSMRVLHANSIQIQLMQEAEAEPTVEQAGLFSAADEEEVEAEAEAETTEEKPALTDLQTRLESPFGYVVQKLIGANPEWGYQVEPELKLILPVDGQPSLEHLQWLIDCDLTSSRARKLIERNPQWGYLIDQDGCLWGF